MQGIKGEIVHFLTKAWNLVLWTFMPSQLNFRVDTTVYITENCQPYWISIWLTFNYRNLILKYFVKKWMIYWKFDPYMCILSIISHYLRSESFIIHAHHSHDLCTVVCESMCACVCRMPGEMITMAIFCD